MIDARAAVGAIVLAVYVGVAFKVGERYPLSRLSMFDHVRRASSRLVARAADGSVRELRALERWTCSGEGGAPVLARRCEEGRAHESEQRVLAWVVARAAPAGGGEPTEIVRRVYSFPDPEGPVRVDDCVLETCTAVRVGGP